MNRAGQIGLVYSTKWRFLPWLIHLITRSKFHHVVIGLDKGECIGAEPGGAKIKPVEDFPDTVWSEFRLGEKQQDEIVAWARAREGRPYSYLTDLAIGVALILPGGIPNWLAAYLSSDWIYECAQLAQAAYLSVGIDLFDGKLLPGEVFPGSFEPVFKKNGWL